MVNINIPDIMEGKPSIILGLIWTIILQYHVSLPFYCWLCLLHPVRIIMAQTKAQFLFWFIIQCRFCRQKEQKTKTGLQKCWTVPELHEMSSSSRNLELFRQNLHLDGDTAKDADIRWNEQNVTWMLFKLVAEWHHQTESTKSSTLICEHKKSVEVLQTAGQRYEAQVHPGVCCSLIQVFPVVYCGLLIQVFLIVYCILLIQLFPVVFSSLL